MKRTSQQILFELRQLALMLPQYGVLKEAVQLLNELLDYEDDGK